MKPTYTNTLEYSLSIDFLNCVTGKSCNLNCVTEFGNKKKASTCYKSGISSMSDSELDVMNKLMNTALFSLKHEIKKRNMINRETENN